MTPFAFVVVRTGAPSCSAKATSSVTRMVPERTQPGQDHRPPRPSQRVEGWPQAGLVRAERRQLRQERHRRRQVGGLAFGLG